MCLSGPSPGAMALGQAGDDVVWRWASSWPLILEAELTSETWENAWGKLPDQAPRDRVVLLGEQAEIVAEGQQPLEELAGIVVAARASIRQSANQNEQARKAPSRPVQPVDLAGVGGPVAEHEAALDQLPLDRLDGSPDPRIGGRQEVHQRDHQQAGVELVGPVVLGERSLVGVEALVADLVVDLLADRLPAFDRALERRTPRPS